MMSIDLVGSTPLAERLSPELLRDVIVAYHDVCDRAIARYDGRIGNRAGDGIMAHFGLENPHETDTRRAALTGLTIIRGLKPLAKLMRSEHDIPIQVRIGIHVGAVVITNIAGRDELVGPAANETARIQSVATPDTVAMSNAAHDQVADEFDFNNSREVEMRGVGAPIRIHDLVGRSNGISAPAIRGPFIGRTAETEIVAAAWASLLRQSTAPPLLISGPAGIGKSRLADVMIRQCVQSGAAFRVLRSLDHDADVAFHPFGPAIRHEYRIDDAAPADEQFDRLSDAVGSLGPRTVAGLAQILGLGTEYLGDFVGADASAVRAAIVEAAGAWLSDAGRAGPAVVLIEDLHWADPSTIDVVARLIAKPPPGVLVVATARAEFKPPWEADAVQTVALEPLNDTEVARVADSMFDVPLTDEQRALLVDRSDGLPLFVTQLAEAGRRGGDLWATEIPNNLDQLLSTRIEAPNMDRLLVGSLAVIGRTCTAELVAHVLNDSVESTVFRLDQLCDQGVLAAGWHNGGVTYGFEHALVQNAAYEHLLPSDRRRTHFRVAVAIDQLGIRADIEAANLARHWDMAGHPARAAALYLGASRTAHGSGATVEARRLAERGLAIVGSVDAQNRDMLEAELRLQHSFVLTAIEGYGSQEALNAVRRADELLDEIHHPETLLRVIVDLYGFATIRGDRSRADQLIAEGRRRLSSLGVDALFDQCDGLQQLAYGNFAAARGLTERAIDRYRADGGDALDSASAATDGMAASYAHLGYLHWVMGDAAASRTAMTRALDRVEQLDGTKRSFNEAYVRTWMVLLAVQSCDYELAAEQVGDLTTLCDAKGLTMWGGFAAMHGAVLSGRTDPSDTTRSTLEMMTEFMSAMHVATYRPYFLAETARLDQELGRTEQAVDVFRQALSVANQNDELQETAEIQRLLARAQLANDEAPEVALEQFLSAGETAATQGATIYGIRAMADVIELFDETSYSSIILDDLEILLDEVATPDEYPDCARARRLLEERR